MAATRELTPAGRRLLDAASELFYAHGITAVGVDAIAAAAGTTKKTLYDRFGSKEGLVLVYLEARLARWQAHVAAHLDTTAARGDDRVLAVLDALASWMGSGTRGCGFVNAYAELSGPGGPSSAVAVVRRDKADTRALYTRLAAEAGRRDPETLGRALALVHEGAIAQASAGGSAQAIPDARRVMRVLLAADRPAVGG